MSRKRTILEVTAALVAIVAGTTLLVVAVNGIFKHLFHGVNPTIAAAIVIGAATVLGSLLTVVIQRRYEEMRRVAEALRDKKVELYTQLLTSYFEIFGLGVERTDAEAEAAINASATQMFQLIPSLVSWASDDVVHEWSRFRRLPITNPTQSSEFALLNFEQVLLAIRRDLGHLNRGVDEGDLLGFWINDINDIVERRRRETKS